MRYREQPTTHEFLAMQTDSNAALRRPWFDMTSELLKCLDPKYAINTEWYVPVYRDFDRDVVRFALRPLAPFVWLYRFWEMNRMCLERVLVHRLMDLPKAGYFRDATWRPLSQWTFQQTRNGKSYGWRLSRPFFMWPPSVTE